MGKVTSKLQVTVPKEIADAYGIRPGATITWQAAGDAIRVTAGAPAAPPLDATTRLRIFDAASARIQQRSRRPARTAPGERGWRREELYDRGRAR